jgi:hypothetical protein
LCYVEDVEENGICESPILGTPVAMFSFDNNATPTNDPMLAKPNLEEQSPVINSPNEDLKFSTHNDLPIKTLLSPGSQPYGKTPTIDGESFDTKRSFSLRNSTVRMVNELKAAHPDVNVYLNTIVDKALRHYHEYILKEKGSQ